MPWTVTDVDKFKRGLTARQKRQWVRIANSILSKCKEEGGVEESCAASAIRQANGVVGNSSIDTHTIANENYTIREERHQGRDFIVVPVIMMVEGVHNGSVGPIFHSIDELGRFPGSWNGIPITIDHPQIDGVFVSANIPVLIDTRTVGRVYNTFIEDNKLKGEAWIDVEQIIQVSPDTLAEIREGNILEVSVGVFTDNEEVENENWNGESYNAIARNHRPDHLALLPGGIGACSVEDGCGIRNNKKKGGDTMNENEVVTAMERKRKELGVSVSEFYAVPRDPPSESKLPIFDAVHVRNALARFNQVQGLSVEEKASAKRKILAKARHFGIDASSLANNLQNELFESIISAKEVGLLIDNVLVDQEEGLLEKVEALRRKIDSMDTQDTIHYLREVYEEYIIYENRMRIGGTKFYKQRYNYNNGTIEFVGETEEVYRKVEYLKVQGEVIRLNKKEVKSMSEKQNCPSCKEKIDKLIANSESLYKEEDRTWLETLEEANIDTIIKASEVKKEEAQVVNSDGNEVNVLSEEDKAALAYGKRQLKARREKFIKGIQDNTSKEMWPDEQLITMSDDMLERVYNSVNKEEVVDYSLNSAGGGNVKAFEFDPLLPPGVEVVEENK